MVERGWGRVVGRGGVEKHCVVTMVRWIMWVWLCDMMRCATFCGGCDVLCCDVKHLLLPRDGRAS